MGLIHFTNPDNFETYFEYEKIRTPKVFDVEANTQGKARKEYKCSFEREQIHAGGSEKLSLI